MNKLRLLPYLLVLSLLAACIETDIVVPCFPEMMQYFGATEAQVQLTLSLNFLGFCLAGMMHGPLSESYGRRPVMLLGSVIFLIGACGSATSLSISWLIAWRFFQGIGASAAAIVVFAMVSDAYQSKEASRLVGVLNASLTAAMAGAPILGGFLADSFGWRSAYSFVAILCAFTTTLLVFLLPETLKDRQPLSIRKILADYRSLVGSLNFQLLTMVPTLQVGGYMAFVGSAVFYYVGVLHLPLRMFTLHQGVVIACFSLVSFYSGSLYERLGARYTVLMGATLNLLGSLALFYLAWLQVPQAWMYTLAMSGFSIGVACCFGATFAASMEVFPDLRGAASSVSLGVRLTVMALTIWLVGSLYNETFVPTAAVILACALLSSLLIGAILRNPKLVKLLT